ncbi:hypothetical protein J437_LFUL000553 [Ladona fulva]|uniref:Uncharacterized protein n=1 Tax=Ladona fulva TaxID=123851 RepID=A0A8K0NV68_LADFU|nr:hypothetical protein J437_LFUL000553 [Ladona fulva]
MPKVFKKMNLKKAEARVLYSIGVAAFKWKDKKDMTKTGKLSLKTKEAVVKPKIVMDYNVQRNAVDR